MGIESLRKWMNPVLEELRQLRSHDPKDLWLVQEMGFGVQDFDDATHVLVGCPQDEGVRRNNGRAGAGETPVKIREQLYRLQAPANSGVKLFDAGDISITDIEEGADTDFLEQVHERLTEVVDECLKAGKKVMVLGGGNDISYADVRALAEAKGDISAVNIDAHLDMRIGDEMTSGTPYRRLIEEEILPADHFYEFGIRPESNAGFYLDDAEKRGVHIHYLKQILENGVISSFRKIMNKIDRRPFFLGLDMDSIRAADAPGVSASSPTGFSGQEVMQLIHIARRKENLRLFEITEVNPKYDVDGRTVKLAAQLVYGFLFG